MQASTTLVSTSLISVILVMAGSAGAQQPSTAGADSSAQSSSSAHSASAQSASAASAQQASAASAAADAIDKDTLKKAVAMGYKPYPGKGGSTVYCKMDTDTGTRFPSKRCVDAQQILVLVQQQQTLGTDMKSGICAGSCGK